MTTNTSVLFNKTFPIIYKDYGLLSWLIRKNMLHHYNVLVILCISTMPNSNFGGKNTPTWIFSLSNSCQGMLCPTGRYSFFKYSCFIGPWMAGCPTWGWTFNVSIDIMLYIQLTISSRAFRWIFHQDVFFQLFHDDIIYHVICMYNMICIR